LCPPYDNVMNKRHGREHQPRRVVLTDNAAFVINERVALHQGAGADELAVRHECVGRGVRVARIVSVLGSSR